MKIIEKIEIKYFRSFAEKGEIYDLKDINIFSGANDSGKSNILRALNLFFNDEISHGNKYQSARDFSYQESQRQKNHKRKNTISEVTVHFFSETKSTNANRSDRFAVKKRFDEGGLRDIFYIIKKEEKPSSNNNPFENIKSEKRFFKNAIKINLEYVEIDIQKANFQESGNRQAAKSKKAITKFLNWISFEYVPAIREEKFFSHIFGKLIAQIKESEKNDDAKKQKMQGAINQLLKEINVYSEDFFSSVDFIQSEFRVGENLNEFFENFDIGTGNEKEISLKLRGDGMQTRFIPNILTEISKLKNLKKYFIWAFEEPENSLEYKNQREMAERLRKISAENKQIFITTHSEEFLSLQDAKGSKISIYGVKNIDGISKIKKYEREDNQIYTILEEIYNDLGASKEKLLVTSLKELLRVGGEEIYKKVQKLKEKLIKPVIFVEDEYDQIYKIAWLKLNNYDCNNETDLSYFDENCNFEIYRGNGRNSVQKKLLKKYLDELRGRKSIGIFDFDDGFEDFNGLVNFKNKQIAEWPKIIQGSESACLWKSRIDDKNVHAMMIPVPESRKTYASRDWPKTSHLSVEHLIEDEKWQKIGVITQKSKDTDRDIEYSIFTGQKKNNWKKLLTLSKEDFTNFKPLFDRINELFEL